MMLGLHSDMETKSAEYREYDMVAHTGDLSCSSVSIAYEFRAEVGTNDDDVCDRQGCGQEVFHPAASRALCHSVLRAEQFVRNK
jgi:hypothetical protein